MIYIGVQFTYVSAHTEDKHMNGSYETLRR
jgi:hypothetical protein